MQSYHLLLVFTPFFSFAKFNSQNFRPNSISISNSTQRLPSDCWMCDFDLNFPTKNKIICKNVHSRLFLNMWINREIEREKFYFKYDTNAKWSHEIWALSMTIMINEVWSVSICSKSIDIKPYSISHKQYKYWQKLYTIVLINSKQNLDSHTHINKIYHLEFVSNCECFCTNLPQTSHIKFLVYGEHRIIPARCLRLNEFQAFQF